MGRIIKKFFPTIKWAIDIWDDPLLIEIQPRDFFKKALYSFYKLTVKRIIKHADIAICIGTNYNDPLPRKLIDIYNLEKNKIYLVPNGVSFKFFNSITSNVSKKNFNIIYVGYIKSYLGLDILLKSFKLVITWLKKYNFKLILVGFANEEDMRWLSRTIKDLAIEEYVEYKGVLPFEEIPFLLSYSDVGIYPFPPKNGLEEVIPIKVLEYLAANLPVVATNLNGVKKIVKHKLNGIIVDYNSISMAKAIIELCKNNRLRKQLKLNARKSVINYDWSIINQNIAQHIYKMLEG